MDHFVTLLPWKERHTTKKKKWILSTDSRDWMNAIISKKLCIERPHFCTFNPDCSQISLAAGHDHRTCSIDSISLKQQEQTPYFLICQSLIKHMVAMLIHQEDHIIYVTSRKPVRCTGNFLKMKSKEVILYWLCKFFKIYSIIILV